MQLMINYYLETKPPSKLLDQKKWWFFTHTHTHLAVVLPTKKVGGESASSNGAVMGGGPKDASHPLPRTPLQQRATWPHPFPNPAEIPVLNKAIWGARLGKEPQRQT